MFKSCLEDYAAIMFCGRSAKQFLQALDFVNINNISLSTYHSIQSHAAYLTQTILSVWKTHQQAMVEEIKRSGRVLRLAGDMRCCTPGQTAQYGSYSLMDLEASKILHLQLIQV